MGGFEGGFIFGWARRECLEGKRKEGGYLDLVLWWMSKHSLLYSCCFQIQAEEARLLNSTVILIVSSCNETFIQSPGMKAYKVEEM